MAIQQLLPQRWGSFFEDFLEGGHSCEVQIEVVAERIGDQFDVEWSVLRGMQFDENHDMVKLLFDGESRFIQSPSEIYVDSDFGQETIFSIIDSSGKKFIIRVREH